MYRSESQKTSFALARSIISNRALKTLVPVNNNPPNKSTLSKTIANFQIKLSFMEEQSRDLLGDTKRIKDSMKSMLDKTTTKCKDVQIRLLSTIKLFDQEVIKKTVKQAEQRTEDISIKCSDLKDKYQDLKTTFDQINQKLERLEACLGYYSGKELHN